MSDRTKFRVWWIPQVPMKTFEQDMPDLATAKIVTETLALYDLFQFENNIKPDYCNTGGIQYSHPLIDDGDWLDVELEFMPLLRLGGDGGGGEQRQQKGSGGESHDVVSGKMPTAPCGPP